MQAPESFPEPKRTGLSIFMRSTTGLRSKQILPTVGTALQLFLVSSILAPSFAYAYVDPGSGSVIVTTILGLIAAVTYTCRKFFYNLKSKIFGKQSKTEERSDDE
jgi:hypothetical protein